MAKTYATITDVEAIVGHPLNATDEARIQELLEAATAAFDRETHQSFLDGAARTGETTHAAQLDLWLQAYPVASVQAVRVRDGAIGSPTTTLAAAVSFDLVDARAGRVRVGSGGPDVFYSVDYTPVNVPPPADVIEAVARWAAYNLSAGGGGAAASGVDTLTVGDVSIRYAAAAAATASTGSGVQPAVERVLDRYRRTVFA